jgi:hypothetical protein
MIRGYLLDEHLPKWWRRELVRHAPGLTVWRVGDSGVPPLESPDAVLLEWCEREDCLLLTDNRSSMAGHLADHLKRGHHIPGIFMVEASLNVPYLAQTLLLIAGASFEGEFADRISYLPRI